MTESLQLAQGLVKLGIEHRRARTCYFRRHLIEYVLMHCRPARNQPVHVVSQAEQDILDAVVDIVDSERDGCSSPPFAERNLAAVCRQIFLEIGRASGRESVCKYE